MQKMYNNTPVLEVHYQHSTCVPSQSTRWVTANMNEMKEIKF